ncbi:short-chain dehydrogenase/reductase [Mycobacterium tuberculosis]|nr:short-chain dehydrogenase/reductase [Mycobacterium tuberculosis]
MTSLAERTVLVTGANRGMGREYVAQLASRSQSGKGLCRYPQPAGNRR